MSDPQEPSQPEPPKPEAPKPDFSTPDASKPEAAPWGAGHNPFSDLAPTHGGPGVPDFYQPVIPPPGWRGDSINGLAVAGLVFSILSAVCCLIFGVVGLALSIPAYYMAQNDLALYSQDLHPVLLGKLKTSKSLALAGIVVGGIGIVFGFVCMGIQFGIPILEAVFEEM